MTNDLTARLEWHAREMEYRAEKAHIAQLVDEHKFVSERARQYWKLPDGFFPRTYLHGFRPSYSDLERCLEDELNVKWKHHLLPSMIYSTLKVIREGGFIRKWDKKSPRRDLYNKYGQRIAYVTEVENKLYVYGAIKGREFIDWEYRYQDVTPVGLFLLDNPHRIDEWLSLHSDHAATINRLVFGIGGGDA